MTFSYTQISQYLACPRRYRYRYLDGWREKETRASLLFGQAFEKALAAYFRKEDCTAVFFQEWGLHRESRIEFSHGDSWDRMAQQGLQLLHLFAQEDRVRIRRPGQNLQVKIERPLSSGNCFVAYVDAIGSVDRAQCLIDWKTTSARYAEQPDGLLALDPQAICYSWMSGIAEISFVVFVRKRLPEIQYLRCSITDEQRAEFEALVNDTVARIDSSRFFSHSGIRFPQNGCVSCSHLGLCLDRPELIDAKLIRQPGASDLDWLDQLE
jgi:PD-(D/E)XK nuclease superfamily protein